MSYAINMLKTMIKNMNPAYIFFEDKTIESAAGNSISLIQFKSYGIDEFREHLTVSIMIWMSGKEQLLK